MPRVAPGYKEDVRRRIMEAALEEVNEHGLQALRMEDVAARVGISRATLYNYFSDKETLLKELLHEMQAEGKAVLEDICLEKSFKDSLSVIFELMVLSVKKMPGGLKPNSSASPPGHRRFSSQCIRHMMMPVRSSLNVLKKDRTPERSLPAVILSASQILSCMLSGGAEAGDHLRI
ncbi:TetR/AcrR family transcriptional regulator [Methanogenium cariaci]|uniref:TetR/AcrR family transcriptional regulator n=1 Tax=Methanogenium cariaci TaxID=2197 RepID=UPI0012F6E9DC|nr:TetR/AcrR family transcriptional regulator [Methanogenium cariaci]